MSSHREAPEISTDPVADNTDLYAFVSPDRPDTVTLIANFLPLEDPAGGPNFFEFADDVLYEIHVDNDGDGYADISYQFRFTTTVSDPNTFLYNTGQITSLDSPNWNRRQFAGVTRVEHGSHETKVLGENLACPPCNIGPLSTPDYGRLAAEAVHRLRGGYTVFTGQRAEGFYVDLGAIFDLADLRPFQNLHVGSTMPASGGINATKAKNVHSIALQVPRDELARGGRCPSDVTDPHAVIGVWSTASRQRSRVYDDDGSVTNSGPWVQVSRLGNPLINEVIIPIGQKDRWNSQRPADDKQFVSHYSNPELSGLLTPLYPGVFPNLETLDTSGKPRTDIIAILLTGLPAGIVPGFQNFTGPTQADLLRLNMAIPPTRHKPSNLGLLGMDPAGFPNGRRVFDDVTTIELRALAGLTYALVDKTFTPDAAAGEITQGLTSSNTDVTAENTVHYLPCFPYLGTPHSGFFNPDNNDPAPDLSQTPAGAPGTGDGATEAGVDKKTLVGGAAALGSAAAIAAVAHQRAGRHTEADTAAATGIGSAAFDVDKG
ncbi:DUF4331 domain-containing protein [Actinospica robiniae]|uniref:DUF4331 domain-containing protein n=1 Tax=Actinospica robiniae TaxID=304901 RepID=UPI0003F79290|nr:DUF4331 domain-containing protein [Actinospica robiniae]